MIISRLAESKHFSSNAPLRRASTPSSPPRSHSASLLLLLYLCHSPTPTPSSSSYLLLSSGPRLHLLIASRRTSTLPASFANNQRRRYTKERAKLLRFVPESFWTRQLPESRLEPGQDVKPRWRRSRGGAEGGEKEKGQQKRRKGGGRRRESIRGRNGR